MPTIPKAWLYGGAAALAVLLMLAVAWSYKSAYDKGEAAGRSACEAAVSARAADDLAKSQKGIINANKKLQNEEDRIEAAPARDDGPIAPVLRHELLRMRRVVKSNDDGDTSPGS